MSCSKVLKDLMVSYIDGEQLASSTLKEKLQLTSPDVRYELLKDVRGVQWDTWTAVNKAAYIHDLEGMQVMLDGMSPEQRYNIVKIENCHKSIPLQWAVENTTTHCSSADMVECLLCDLSLEQQFQQYISINDKKNTVLHYATYREKTDTILRILNPCTRDQKLQLMGMRNAAGLTPADRSLSTIFSTVKELEWTKKELRDQKKTSNEQIQKLEKALDETRDELNTRKISSQVQVDELRLQNDQLKQELKQTNKALADVKKTSGVQLESNLQLKKDQEEQTKVVEETKKDLAALQETSNKQIEELKKQQTQALVETKKELADVQKSNNELVVELVRRNMQLERDNNQQTQVIQALSARQAAMEQMLERLELEFRRPIVTDETGDQENEDY